MGGSEVWMNALIGFALCELVALMSWRLGRGAPDSDQAARANRMMAPVMAVLGPIVAVVILPS